MLTNQDTLKTIESIIMTKNEQNQNELLIGLTNSDNKITSTLKSLVIRENDNIKSRRKQKLHQKIKEEEEKYFNDSETTLSSLSTKVIKQSTDENIITSLTTTSSTTTSSTTTSSTKTSSTTASSTTTSQVTKSNLD
jgi:hypothetical protein